MDNKLSNLKLILVGDERSGKSTFVKKYISGEFEDKYIASSGVEVNPIDIYTTRGKVRYSVWDVAKQIKSKGLRDGYYCGAQCAIIMYDTKRKMDYKAIANWQKGLLMVCGPIPIVLVGSKADQKHHQLNTKDITFCRRNNLQHYVVSSKSNRNIEKPFLWFARKMVGSSDLNIVDMPASEPRGLLMDPDCAAQLELRRAAEIPLPDEDENF